MIIVFLISLITCFRVKSPTHTLTLCVSSAKLLCTIYFVQIAVVLSKNELYSNTVVSIFIHL